MSVVYTQKILFPRFPLINMPLFHRRALLNSLPAHKRGDAKRAYKKTVADLGASVVMFFVVALVCTLTYHEFVNPNTDRPSGLPGSTQRLLASHQSNSSNLAPSPSATTADTLMAMGGGAGAGGRPGGNRAALKAFGQKHAT